MPVEQKTSLLQTLEALGQDEAEYAGLLVAVASDEVVGAVWVQFTAGQTAIVWPPAIDGPAAADLMRAVAALLDQRRVALAQFLVSDERTVDHDLLAVADFQKLAKLAYFTVDSRLFPTTQPQSQLVFQPNAAAEPKRFGELLLRTYVDSLDCPQLNGVRQTADVLAGYREQGLFSPERWFFIQHEDHDVGALILTEHADTGNWELVYMGLVAEARGAGWVGTTNPQFCTLANRTRRRRTLGTRRGRSEPPCAQHVSRRRICCLGLSHGLRATAAVGMGDGR